MEGLLIAARGLLGDRPTAVAAAPLKWAGASRSAAYHRISNTLGYQCDDVHRKREAIDTHACEIMPLRGIAENNSLWQSQSQRPG